MCSSDHSQNALCLAVPFDGFGFDCRTKPSCGTLDCLQTMSALPTTVPIATSRHGHGELSESTLLADASSPTQQLPPQPYSQECSDVCPGEQLLYTTFWRHLQMEVLLHANVSEIFCAVARYDWFGDHNLPWQTDLNTLNNTIDWNKLNAITATPNPFDNRDPAQTGGGFGLLPWYLRSAVITQRAAPGPAPGPAPAAQVVGR